MNDEQLLGRLEAFFIHVAHGSVAHRCWLHAEFQRFWDVELTGPAVEAALQDPVPVDHPRYPCHICGVRGTWRFVAGEPLVHEHDPALVAMASPHGFSVGPASPVGPPVYTGVDWGAGDKTVRVALLSTQFDEKIWRTGCDYQSSAHGWCNKCGDKHEQTYKEAHGSGGPLPGIVP